MKKALLILATLVLTCTGCACGDSPVSVISHDNSPKVTTSAVRSTATEPTVTTTEPEDIDLLDYLNLNFTYDTQTTCAITLWNETSALLSATLQVTARDENNSIIATDSFWLTDIFPGRFYYRAYNTPIHEKAASIEYEITEYTAYQPPEWYDSNFIEPKVVNTSLRNNNETITGEIVNDNDFDLPKQSVYLIFFDENGDVIPPNAAYHIYTSEIKAHSSVPFQIDTYFGLDLSQINYNVSVELKAR